MDPQIIMKSANQTPTTSETTEPTIVSRGEFMRSLGMSSAALMAFYCMGTMTSCKGSDPAPVVVVPPVVPPVGGSTGVTGSTTGTINFTLDLTNTNFTALKTPGSFVSVGELIVFNAAGTYRALSRTCTHAGGNLSFQSASNDLICSIHAGLFNVDGSVKRSPPTTGVKAYTATLTGNNLQVK